MKPETKIIMHSILSDEFAWIYNIKILDFSNLESQMLDTRCVIKTKLKHL